MYDEHLYFVYFIIFISFHWFTAYTHTHAQGEHTHIEWAWLHAQNKREKTRKFGFRKSEKPIRTRTRNRTKPNATKQKTYKASTYESSNPDRLLNTRITANQKQSPKQTAAKPIQKENNKNKREHFCRDFDTVLIESRQRSRLV